MNTDQEARCLAYNPFDGGKGDDQTRVLRDRIVTARKGGECCICLGNIISGMRVRVQVGVLDGRAKSFRMCEPCCNAMAASWRDDGRAIERRTSMGMLRARVAG